MYLCDRCFVQYIRIFHFYCGSKQYLKKLDKETHGRSQSGHNLE